MKRRIITIDHDLCNGCGLCAQACHEGAIIMEDGKARLLREDYCDGLGDCLPACPAGAISFEEREALPYDHAAVQMALAAKKMPSACPSSQVKTFAPHQAADTCSALPSALSQWPVQLQLAPITAPHYQDAHLLIAADCSAYAYGDFHRRFISGRITLIGCPKLDPTPYTDKLTAILGANAVQSVTLTRMEVPCCGGLENALRQALAASGKTIPLRVVTITTDGRLLEN